MEKEIAEEFKDILKQHNVKSISLYKLMAELEIATINHLKFDHATKASLGTALKINRTTLSEKIKRFKIRF